MGGKDDTPDRLHDDNEHLHDNHPHINENQHSDMDTQEHHHKKTHKHTHSQSSGRSRNHSSSHSDIQGQGHTPIISANEGQTAHKILNLLNELGHSNLVDRSASIEQQFHPCKYCKGRLQIL